MKMGSKEYRQALHRHLELVVKGNWTDAERAEMDRLNRAMSAAEYEHDRAYTEAMLNNAGSLGGVTLK